MGFITPEWVELLEPNLRVIFDKNMKAHKDYVNTIYNVEGSKKAQETNLGMGNIGLMEEWEQSGSQVAYEDVNKGFTSTYRHRKYSKGLKVERELVEDDQYGEIKKRVRLLTTSVHRTRQVHAASPFNFAFGGGMVGPDGKPLCATDHPIAPGSTDTFKNAGNKELNATSVEETRAEMRRWTDDKGNLLVVEPDTLIVPGELRKAALVIADTEKEPDTNENNINIWKGSLNVIEWPFLTDPKVWFMVDSERMKSFLNWYDRRKAKLESENIFDTEVAKYKTVVRFSYGWDDPSFIYGHKPS